MSDSDFPIESDIEMEDRLRRFAKESRTLPLPEETAALPWTVQLERPRTGVFDFAGALAAGAGSMRRSALGFARLALTLAVAGAFLAVVGQARTGGSAANFVQPLPTPRPTGAGAALSGPEVVVVPTSGVVDDVMADHVAGAIRRAESDGAAAVIVQLDTLGGSEDAMLRIDAALHSKVPTIVWVGPSGASAASAGTFITLSANLAYMAPSTNIGAASPVAAGGGDIAATYGQTEADKVMQDAMAKMRGIAQERHPWPSIGQSPPSRRRNPTRRRRLWTLTRSTASPRASMTSWPRLTARPSPQRLGRSWSTPKARPPSRLAKTWSRRSCTRSTTRTLPSSSS